MWTFLEKKVHYWGPKCVSSVAFVFHTIPNFQSVLAKFASLSLVWCANFYFNFPCEKEKLMSQVRAEYVFCLNTNAWWFDLWGKKRQNTVFGYKKVSKSYQICLFDLRPRNCEWFHLLFSTHQGYSFQMTSLVF